MPRLWMLALIAALLGALIVAAFLSGEPTFAIPVVLVALAVLGFFAFNRLLGERALAKHGGDPAAVMADNEDPLPSTAVIPEDSTALGDTDQAHSEINAHDLPMGHPGREEAARQAGGTAGSTSGDTEGQQPPPGRDDQPARSADRAK